MRFPRQPTKKKKGSLLKGIFLRFTKKKGKKKQKAATIRNEPTCEGSNTIRLFLTKIKELPQMTAKRDNNAHTNTGF